ncbi:MAG: helix-turn-helix domain-containing protein [Vulcanimicrobiaceae bacterium]
MQTAAEGMGLNPDVVSIAPQIQLDDVPLQHICWALVAELEDGEPHDRLYADSLGMALAAHLLRRYSIKVPPKVTRQLSKRQLQRETDYIHSNLDLNLSLRELAEVAGVSASYFKALFKESVGVPVHQYVVRRRVESAAKLLLQGTPTISEVALQAGFSDQSHMARCMRRVLGTTPGEIVRQRR